MPPLTRRQFVRTAGQIAAATALTAKSYSQVAGSNERTRIGIIGFGLVGRIHTRSFHSLNSSKVVAVSDCFGPRMDACAELVGPDCSKIPDFRRLLERKDIDAVVIAT